MSYIFLVNFDLIHLLSQLSKMKNTDSEEYCCEQLMSACRCRAILAV